MKLATTIGEIYDYVSSPAEAIRSYRNSGFRYLDYSFYYDHLNPSPFLLDDDRNWKQQIHESGEAAAQEGFTFVQAHLPGYNPMGRYDTGHNNCMRAMLRCAEACGILQIPTVVMHTSFSPVHQYPMDQKAYFEYNRKFLLELLEIAAKYNFTLCIENTSAKNMGSCYFPRTPEEMNDFLTFMDHPNLGCCWDTGHAVMENRFDQYSDLMELGTNLKAVHIHDNNALSDQHLPPYCGKLEIDRVVEALKDLNFPGYFTFEADAFLNYRNGSSCAADLPLEVRQAGLALLYRIGKAILEKHNIFEE